MVTAFVCLLLSRQILGLGQEDFKSPAEYRVPFRQVLKNFVAVQVQLNGMESWFLLDTGAVVSFLTAKTWGTLKHEEGEEDVEVNLECGSLSSKLTVQKVPDQVERVLVRYKVQVDGILGLDFLESRALGLDIANSSIAIFPESVPSSERFRQWFGSIACLVKDKPPIWIPWAPRASASEKGKLTALSFQATMPGYQAFPTIKLEERMVVPIDVEGVTVDCVLDTAASISTFLAAPLKGKVSTVRSSNYSVNGLEEVLNFSAKSIKLGSYELAPAEGITAAIAEHPVLDTQGLIGIDVLGKHKVLMDFSSGTVGFSPYQKTPTLSQEVRYYRSQVYIPSQKKIMRFRSGWVFPVPDDFIVLGDTSHTTVTSSAGGLTTLKID